MNNKKLGSMFETELCNKLAQKGYWVHLFAPNQAGQPADVIAVKGRFAYLIDCKVCSNGYFDFSRVEENQHFAMTLWRERGNGEGLFALKIDDEIYILKYDIIEILKRDYARVPKNMIEYLGVRLDAWL